MSVIVTIIGVVDGAGLSASPASDGNEGAYPDLPLQIFQAPPCTFFYNRISHWREKTHIVGRNLCLLFEPRFFSS